MPFFSRRDILFSQAAVTTKHPATFFCELGGMAVGVRKHAPIVSYIARQFICFFKYFSVCYGTH